MSHSNAEPDRANRPPASAGLNQSLCHLVSRLEAVITEEMHLLATGAPTNIERLIDRKSSLAEEVLRLARLAEGFELNAETRSRLATVARSLSESARSLKLHRDALDMIILGLTRKIDNAGDAGLYARPVISRKLSG